MPRDRFSEWRAKRARDFVYTNWSEADQFMHEFIDTLERHAHAVQEKQE